MKLGHGSHRRTPWWCWLVMLLAALLTLPGAASVAGGKRRQKHKAREARRAESRGAHLGRGSLSDALVALG